MRGAIDETALERWQPYAGPRKHCRECCASLIEKLVEVSIIDTYRCPFGHRFLEITP